MYLESNSLFYCNIIVRNHYYYYYYLRLYVFKTNGLFFIARRGAITAQSYEKIIFRINKKVQIQVTMENNKM